LPVEVPKNTPIFMDGPAARSRSAEVDAEVGFSARGDMPEKAPAYPTRAQPTVVRVNIALRPNAEARQAHFL